MVDQPEKRSTTKVKDREEANLVPLQNPHKFKQNKEGRRGFLPRSGTSSAIRKGYAKEFGECMFLFQKLNSIFIPNSKFSFSFFFKLHKLT